LKYIPQELYNQILETMPISCVDVCIVWQGKILLVKRKDQPAKDEWWVPGGRVIKGESLKEAAYRKAFEETGIYCHVGPIIYTDETVFDTGPDDIHVHSINVVFLLYPKYDNLLLKLDEHSSEFAWVSKISNELDIYVQKCLEKAGLDYED
jgi:ADP-ribose pyrophosphatase YjhB (NUDIX family)